MEEVTKEKTIYQQVMDGEKEPTGKEIGYSNLRRYDTLTEQEKFELHSKGGKARKQKQRDRKTFKDGLIDLLKSDDKELIKGLARESESQLIEDIANNLECNIQDLVSVAVLIQGLQGNVKGLEFIRDTIGERPKDQVELNADIVTSADRTLIENLRKRLNVGDIAQEEDGEQ